MHRSIYPLAALILLGMAARASAQTYQDQTFRPESVRWHFGAGYSPTLGTASQYFGDGFTLDAGTTWQPSPAVPLALRTDFDYSRFDATGNVIADSPQLDAIGVFRGRDEIFGLSFDGEYLVRLSPRIRGFALAGLGVAHSDAPLSEAVAFCNPSAAPCSSGLPPAFVVPLGAQSTRLSWNAGLGLDFALRDGMTVFLEARYLRVQTPTPFEFVPITLGISF